MKRSRGWLITISLLLIFLFVIPSFLYAQVNAGDPGCDPLDPGCPIDGGVVALLITGAGYGVKKIVDIKNKV